MKHTHKLLSKLLLSGCLIAVSILTTTAQVQDGSTPPSFNAPVLNIGQPLSSVNFNAPNMAQIDYEDQNSTEFRPRIGVTISADISLTTHGKWQTLPNGDRIWRAKIHVPGAAAVGFNYNDFYLPAGAKLYIYDESKTEVQGGFTETSNPSSGLFATSPTTGETAIIEYYEPAVVRGQGHLHINELVYMYRNWDLYKDENQNNRDFGDSDPCEVNVNCTPEGNGKTSQRDGVCRVLTKVGSGYYWCSGTLINNVRQDCTPYFLLALHCGLNGTTLTTAADINQWIFYFKYQAPTCTDPSSQGTLANNYITGATHKSNSNDNGGSTGSDFLLLQLNTTPPTAYSPYYNGWNRANTAPASGFGIHHPAGDIKKISTFTTSASSTSWGGTTANTHWQLVWAATTNGHGVTEGGSSGSPLFNSSYQVVGTLTGGGSYCTATGNPDAYGKFSYHWDQNGAAANRRLKDWLDPDNTGVTSLAGIYAPCSVTALDAGIVDIINPPDGQYVCDSVIIPRVVIQNIGSTTLTSASIKYHINTNPVSTYSWTGSLTTAQTDTVTLPAITTPTATAYNFQAYTTNPNGGTDGDHANDTTTVISQYNAALPLPYSEAFNTGSLPANITVWDMDGDSYLWQYNNTVNAFGGTGGSMKMDNFSPATSIAGTLDWFFVPDLDFSNVSSAKMTFDVAYARYSATFSDTLLVAVATDCGTTYYIEYLKGGASLSTAPTTTSAFTPTSAQWRKDTVDLSSYAGTGHVSIAFINYSGYGNNIYVDNINVQTSCLDTTYNITASICAGGSYTLPNGSTVSTTGVYNNSFTSHGGCDSNYVVTLTVNPLPSVGVSGGSSQSVCSGNSITLNGTGATSYTWTGGVTNGVAFTPGSTSTYTVTGTDANTCTKTATVTVTVNTSPTVDAGTNQSVCPGTSVTLNGSGAVSYSWTGGVSNGVPFTPATTTTYTVTGTAANSCTSTDVVTVTVYPVPPVNGGADVAVCTGASVTLSGSGAVSYSWTGGISNGVPFVPGASGTYTVTGTDANSCTATDVVAVTVTSTLNVSAGSDISVCSGNTVTLTGTGAVNYSWNNGVNNGIPFTPGSTNTYIVTGDDGGSCTDSDTITVTVLTSPTVSAGSPQTVCAGTNVTLNGSGATSYAWSGGITNGVPFTPVATTIYTVTGTAANTCTGTSTVTVTVNNLPTVSGGSGQSVCTGASVTLSGSGATGYTWTGGVTNGVPFTPVATNTYTVTGTDANSCSNTATVTVIVNSLPVISAGSNQTVCAGDNVTLSGSGGLSYTWTGGVNNNVPFTPASTNTYTVTGTDANSCTNTATVTVIVNALPTVSITAPSATVFCINEPAITLTGTPSGGNFSGTGISGNSFTPATAGAGTHTITYSYTDGNNCSGTDNLSLEVLTCTGIEDITNAGEPVIYPNPGTDNVWIQLPEAWSGKVSIRMITIDGKLVQTWNKMVSPKESLYIETGNLAGGVYIFIVEKDNYKAHLRWVRK